MKAEIAALIAEAKSMQEKSSRPKYPRVFKTKAVELLKQISVAELADALGIKKKTLERWHTGSCLSKGTFSDPAGQQITFSPVVREESNSLVVDRSSGQGNDIRLDITYRDGRRMVIHLPASPSATQEILASLRQDFFRGC